MVAKILGAQRDFSYGEVDVALKRADDHPARKAGLRQMANARILNSGAVQDRPGRRALYPVTNSGKRTERVVMASGSNFDIQFAAGRLKIIDSTGTTVGNFTTQGNGAALPWSTAANIATIVYAVFNKSIYVTYTGMRPQIVSWDGASTWTIADYNETVTPGGQKRTPFYRISPQDITLQPSATVGNINVDFSSAIAVAGMVGTRLRYCGRQLTLTGLTSTTRMTATVNEPLPPSQTLTLTGLVGAINLGDEVIGSVSNAKGIVTATATVQTLYFPNATPASTFQIGDALTGGTSGATGTVTAVAPVLGTSPLAVTVLLSTATAFASGEVVTGAHGAATTTSVTGSGYIVQLLPNGGTMNIFSTSDRAVGPSGSTGISAVSTTAPQPVAVWDEEVMNTYRGFPLSVFVDQFRLGFCDFPSVPGGIAWSAINTPTDLFVGANPSDAMFEIAPAKVRVLYVVPGPESNEFVFCDSRVYYIPISPTNPLRPGSVQFLVLSGDGAAQVQPRLAQEAILYANAGQSSVMAIIATGAYLRPFNTRNLSEYHYHLFNGITAIAAPSADGTFNERYVYVLNGDGSIAVGKYDADTLPSKDPVIGWGPWSGNATVTWIAARAADVIFTSTYFSSTFVEILDDAQYLDCAVSVNSLPAAFTPPLGKGPLYLIAAGQTVSLIDQTTRIMGTYSVDANGFIVPQFNGGEDLTISSLVAGQPWTMTVEPFVPDASPGQSVGQRMFRRRVARFAANVIHSTGFMMARLFSGTQTPTSPALGTVMNFTRFPPWNVGDNPLLPPPQREIVERTRPLGRSFDPRVAVIKDTPGPLQILELGVEATI